MTMTASVTISVFGDWTLASGMVWTVATNGVISFAGRGITQHITSNGFSINQIYGSNCGLAGTIVPVDNLLCSFGFNLNSGTWDFTVNNVNSTFQSWNFNNTASTSLHVKLGSGTHTINGAVAALVSNLASGVIVGGTSTMVISDTSSTAKTFAGGGNTFNNLSITGGGTGAVTISGSNTFNTVTIGSPKSVVMTASTTTTVQNLVAWGSSGNLVTFTSSTPGTAWNIVGNTVVYIWCDWLSLTDSHASGTTAFYAGADSTSVSGNTGWTFANWTMSGSPTSTTVGTSGIMAGSMVGTPTATSVGTQGIMAGSMVGTPTATSVGTQGIMAGSMTGAPAAVSTLTGIINQYLALAMATETDTSMAIFPSHVRALLLALEHDKALTITPGSAPVPPLPPVSLVVKREYPPTRLSINITSPSGARARWSSNEVDPLNSHQALTFSSTMPGGFENADMTLNRNPRRSFPDLEEFETLTIRLPGGSVVWEGRLESLPDVSGDQMAIQPGAVGWQSALTDDNAVQELFIDSMLSNWEGSPAARKIQIQQGPNGGYGPMDINDASTVNDPDGTPSLTCQISDGFDRAQVVEGWYDSHGISIGRLLYVWEDTDVNLIGDQAAYGSIYTWSAYLSDTTTPGGPGTDADSSGNLNVSNLVLDGSGEVVCQPGNPDRVFAVVQLWALSAGGNSGVNYPVYWPLLQVIGNHGLPTYPSADSFTITRVRSPTETDSYGTFTFQGLLGSDVLEYAINKYSTLNTNWRGGNSITPSSFVIPQLIFPDSGSLSDVIKAVTAFELQDWAVWEDKTFWWYPRGNNWRPVKNWRGQIGPCKLQNAGPQVDRLWNGVIVQFTDITGIIRTAGPPGSNCSYIDASLADSDPQNPINEAGLRRWAILQASAVPLPQTAIRLGQIFLQEQALLNSSGSAELQGFCEDDAGVIWPACCVRAGDNISFTDAADSSYRRIVSTQYNDDTRVNSIQLDTPPDTIQAILGRLQAVLAPITGT
jgi:hypothetical protein